MKKPFAPPAQKDPKLAPLVKAVIFFPNGNTAAVDHDGNQMPQLQEAWFRLYVKFLVENGVDPLTIDFQMPQGYHIRAFKTEDGYNWHP